MRILEEFWYGNIEPTEYDRWTCTPISLGVAVRSERSIIWAYDIFTKRTRIADRMEVGRFFWWRQSDHNKS